MKKLDLKIITGLLLLSLGPTVFAQPTFDHTTNQMPENPAVWRNQIGGGFRPDTYGVGFSTAASIGTPVFGTRRHHDLALGTADAAWILPESLPHHFFAGNLELRGELFGGGQFHPREHYVTGFTVMPRYDFAIGKRFVPFIDGGAGGSATDIGPPDLGGIFEFNLQWGGGTYYFLRPNLALSVEYRWLHLSDAGITKINQGVNTQVFAGGLNWFF